MEKQDKKEKIKFKEKLSIKFRKKWLVTGTKTFLVIAILFAAYFAINLWAAKTDLPQLDVTENKVYSLSDASKNALSSLNQETIIYVYGYKEDSTFVDLLKQYNKVNEKVTYKIITEENNYEMVQEYGLEEGYQVLIFKANESEKLVDASTEFSTYDYTTNTYVDITEQVITNSILSLTEENKVKVYFLEGHNEFASDDLTTLHFYLQNEAFETANLNILTHGSVPEDCNVLAIMSPTTNLLDTEIQAIKDYIYRGGDIYFSRDTVTDVSNLSNWQTILDEFGVVIQDGVIMENESDKAMADYPFVFMPEISSTHKITTDIHTDSYMWMAFVSRLKFNDNLEALNVTKEVLINSSESASFVTDLVSADLTVAMETAEKGACDIAALLSKTITNAEGETSTSNLIISANAAFISDNSYSYVSESSPISNIGSNKDFVINSFAFLGEKENTLTIRKDLNNSYYTYAPTEEESRIVLTIIFVIPVFIIVAGLIIWRYRMRKK